MQLDIIFLYLKNPLLVFYNIKIRNFQIINLYYKILIYFFVVF